MSDERKQVKWKHLTATVTRFTSGLHEGKWRVQYKNRAGKWLTGGILKDWKKAESRAEELLKALDDAEELERSLTDDELGMVETLRQYDVTKVDLEAWCESRAGASKVPLAEAAQTYVDTHVKRQDYSRAHYNDIIHTLNLLKETLGVKVMALLRIEELEKLLTDTKLSAKRQNNMRGVLSGFWKWAVHRGYCEKNIVAAIQPLKIKKRSGGHEVLSPKEFAIILDACPDLYIPWLAISGFAGCRGSEIVGRTGDRESALRWEDFHFDRDHPVIMVRPETSKTNGTRIVPLCAALSEWLEPWKKSNGLVHPHVRPSSGTTPVTQTLGKLIKGWKKNALRSSAASYRFAETKNLSQTAIEMGHTETMLKTNYLNPRFEEDAALWWSLTPAVVAKIVKEKDVIKMRA